MQRIENTERTVTRNKWACWRLLASWLTGVAISGGAPAGLVSAAITAMGRGLVRRDASVCKAQLVRLVALADGRGERWWITPAGEAALEVSP